jgi:catechol 2,3-dioxygenase
MHTNRAPFTTAPSRYQLPDSVQLGAVTLQVANLERSLAYYQSVIGLRVIAEGNGRAALGALNGAQVLVHLVEKRGVRPVPPRGLLGLYHFAILLPTREALGQFLSHLSRLNQRAGMSDHLVSEALYLTDPDGLGIEVYADRPKALWKMDGAAIAMATDPLDVRSVLAAGGDIPWIGMPEGAAIGHVHLHVGNLEDSARFYHEGIGFDKVNLQFGGALFLSAGGYHHHLGTNIWAANAPAATADDARLLDWTVLLPTSADVHAVEQSVREAGYSGAYEAARDTSAFVVADPWGSRVRVTVMP